MPDEGYHPGCPQGTWVPTAAIVVDVVPLVDETFDKFASYAGHEVDELIVADPSVQLLTIWRRTSGEGYRNAPGSALWITAAQLAADISWPDETD